MCTLRATPMTGALLTLSILCKSLLHSQYTMQVVATLSVYYASCCYTLSILCKLLLHSQYTMQVVATLSVCYASCCYTLSILCKLLLHSQYTMQVVALSTLLQYYNTLCNNTFAMLNKPLPVVIL